jgi:dTDP-4-dehydrorhamnose reductase
VVPIKSAMVETIEAKSMILVTGVEGQLGKSLNAMASSMSHNSIGVNRKELDVIDKSSVSRVIKSLRPNLVVNCAAWTNVDEAEKYPQQATEINAYGALNLAEACKSIGARFFQISTDYVFSGNKQEPWDENDTRSPTSQYGVSKSLGEELVLETYPENSFIIRTSWLYGLEGNNFLTKILQKIKEQEEKLRIVDDQIGQPTLVTDLAARILQMSSIELNSKIYHATNTGQTSWYGFASRIFNLLNQPVDRISAIQTSEYNSPARRPAFSVLGQSAWADSGLLPMRYWGDALDEVLRGRVSTKGDFDEN